MIFKRNFFTIIYAVCFLAIMALALFNIMNLTITTASSKYMIAGVIVLGIIIYLIAAFLVKEKGSFLTFEKPKTFFVLLECLVVLAGIGCLFVIRYVDSLTLAILHSLLLLSFYLIARFLFGRLNGILTTVVGFAELLLMQNIIAFDINQTISVLSFLLPFAAFLGIHRILMKRIATNGFLIFMSCFVSGFLFSIAIALNPLVFLLFAGCVFSLLFARPDGEHVTLAKGIICALFFALSTIALLLVIHFMIPELLFMPSLKPDTSVPSLSVDFLSYLINKLEKPVTYLQLSFGNGIIPTVLVFFSLLSGYYAIAKKASYIGPLLFSFVGLFFYYILFCEVGSDFCYFTYFLPIFAGYGITNTLIPEIKLQKDLADENSVSQDLSDETGEPPHENETDVLPEQNGTTVLQETPYENGTTVIQTEPEQEDTALPDEPTESDSESSLEPDGENIEILEDIVETENDDSLSEQDKKKRFKISKKEEDEIPEWTIPSEFMKTAEPDSEASPEPDREEPAVIQIPESSLTADTEELLSEPELSDIPEPDTELLLEPELQDISEADTEALFDTELEPVFVSEEEADFDSTLKPMEETETADFDSFIDEPEEPEPLVDNIQDDVEYMDQLNESSNMTDIEYMDQLNESSDMTENESMDLLNENDDVTDIEQFIDYETDNETNVLDFVEEPTEKSTGKEEEQQLDELLERLEISDNIKRMNESAQEDMADVIEREEEQTELDEALPLKPSNSTLPKYKKPKFDFDLAPMNIPLDENYSNISEYDEVPTIHELESRWKSKDGTVIESVAMDVPEEESVSVTKKADIHSEEIIKKTKTGKRSYHRITIR